MLGLRSSLAGASLIAGLALLATAPAPAAAAACPNQAIREAQGTAALALPECRAYELVSPAAAVPSLESGTLPQVDFAESSASGGRAAYFSYYPNTGDSSEGFQFLSTRLADGWSTRNLIPPQSSSAFELNECAPGVYYSEDLGSAVLNDGFREPSFNLCPSPEPPLSSEEPQGGYENLFLRDNVAESYLLINRTPEGVHPQNAHPQSASTDLSHVVFAEQARLTPDAPEGYDLYDWSAGELHFVTYLPNGTPVAGYLPHGFGLPGMQNGQFFNTAPITHDVSADGERIFFNAEGKLYERLNASQPQSAVGPEGCTEPALACTVEIDASSGAEASGGGRLLVASLDGSHGFFLDERKLTPDSGARSGKPDLYEYELEGQRITDLTANGGEGGNVLGYAGVSADSSYIYFVAKKVLAGSGTNSEGAQAQAGKPNLYLAHAGTVTFIVTLGSAAATTGQWGAGELPVERSAASPDGRFLAFSTTEPLTGYDNTPAEPGDCELKCAELFLFDAQSSKLSCISCGSAGSHPLGGTWVKAVASAGAFGQTAPLVSVRPVFDDGTVLFTTPNPLSSSDANGIEDVYESEPPGVGECTESSAAYSSQDGVCHHLLSTGASQDPSLFADASADHSNVFFVTSQPLVRGDTGAGPSLYDARVNGGFPEPPPTPECEEEGCRGARPGPPIVPTASTPQFEGPQEGPLHPRCAKGFVRRYRRCVKPRRHRGHRHRHRARANSNPGSRR